jgi:hypothetical protein
MSGCTQISDPPTPVISETQPYDHHDDDQHHDEPALASPTSGLFDQYFNIAGDGRFHDLS